MRDLAPELRQALDAIPLPDLWSDIGSREPAPPRHGPSPVSRIGVALLALVVAAGGLVLVSRSFRAEPTPVRPAARIENGVLAFRSFEIWVVNPDGSGLRRLNRLECINDACDVAEGSLVLAPWEWSPDGTRLACYGYAYHQGDSGGADYAIFLMSADGSEVTDLTSELPELEGTSQGNPRWSPDGTRLAFDNDDGIYVVNADGSGVTKVARGGFPSWSPDGTRIAFVTGSEGGGSEIRIAAVDGTGETTVTSGGGSVDLPAWSPDGSRIAYVGWVKGEGPQLYVVNPDGTGETRLTDLRSDGMGGYSPTWSPDGSRIAVEVFQHGNWNIYLVQADGSGVRQLTDAPGDENRPTWAPDGTKIAFMRSPIASSEGENSASFDVYVINPDASGLLRLTDGAGAAPGALTWQPLIVSGESPAPTPTASPSTTPTPSPVNPRITATIKVGDFPNAVAVGEGSVWISVPNNDGTATGQILRVDPATNEIVAQVPIIAIPTWETGGGGLTAGAGSIWVAGSAPARDLGDDPGGGWEAGLLRIDPDRNEVVATVPLGGESGADVAVTGDAAWVLIFSGSNQMSVLRIDPLTDRIVANIPVPGVWGQEIFATENGVFVNTRDPYPGEDSTVGASRLTMIDPSTNQVRWTVADMRFVESFQSDAIWAQGGGTKYANVGGDDLLRLDPQTGQPLGEPFRVGALGGAFAVAPDGGVWFSGSDQQGWTIGRFDPVTSRIDASVGTGDFTQDNRWWPTAVAMDPASETIWLVHYRDNVTRIDLG